MTTRFVTLTDAGNAETFAVADDIRDSTALHVLLVNSDPSGDYTVRFFAASDAQTPATYAGEISNEWTWGTFGPVLRRVDVRGVRLIVPA